MTDPSDYTAKIRTKGLDATGVTEQLAGEMYRNKGRHYMAIVEVKVDETHEKADGTRKVDLILTQVEPATNGDFEEHLRELTRVGYLNRQRTDGQMAIDESLGAERTVADVVASGRSHRPHPFLPDDAAKDTPICDVCGGIEASAVHSTQDILDDPEDHDQGDSQTTSDEAHEYEPGPDDSCLHCGQAEHPDFDLPPAGQLRDEDRAELDAITDDDPWAYDGPEGTNADEVPESNRKLMDPFASSTT